MEVKAAQVWTICRHRGAVPTTHCSAAGHQPCCLAPHPRWSCSTLQPHARWELSGTPRAVPWAVQYLSQPSNA